jgi:penicillin amidase
MRRAAAMLALLVLLPLGPPARAATSAAIPGPLGAARVVRDRQGIAHIQAANRHDAFFLQGWTHAQDRLFQMDVRRRQASGTLAELLGPDALPSDVQLRTIGLRRAAARSLPLLTPQDRAGLQAYADGVNAWVAGHPLPPEYAALHLTGFAPWTPLDSVTVGKLIAFGLSFDIDDISRTFTLFAYQLAGQAHGFDGTKLFYQDLERSQPFSSASTVPDASGQPPHSGSATASATAATAAMSPGVAKAVAAAHSPAAAAQLRTAATLARRYLAAATQVPALSQALSGDFSAIGSNEWGVAASHSATGQPMIANDPHLPLAAPSTFYPVQLQIAATGTNVVGASFAGAPGVIVGHNDFISWGATVNPMDVTDTYLEQVKPDPAAPSGLATVYKGQLEPVVAIPEVFKTNNPSAGQDDDVTVVPPGGAIPAATLIVPRRNNGPIILLNQDAGSALSVQYTGFSGTREVDTFDLWDNAKGLADFERGLQFFDVGDQNWAYSDVHGNLAYFTSSEMPIREDLQAGTVSGQPPFLIRNGTGGNEWLPVQHPQPGQAIPYEILPQSELPHIVNPPAGFFVNGNNDPIGTSLDNDPLNQTRPGGGIYYLNPGYDGIRGGRITQLLRARLAHGKVSVADMQRIQADTGLLDAQVFVPYVVRALKDAKASSDPTLATLGKDPAVQQAVGRLAAWDFTTPTGIPQGYDAADVNGHLGTPSRHEIADSAAATIYALWRGQFLHNTIDAFLDPLQLPRPQNDERSLTALQHLLLTFNQTGGVGASGVDFFQVPGVASAADRRDVLLLRSVRGALDEAAGPSFAAAFHGSTNQDDYRWGLLHRIVFAHPMGGQWSVPPAFGAFPQPLAGLPGVPRDGGFDTVNVGTHDVRAADPNGFMFDSGGANRYVSAAGRSGVTAQTSLPGGTSGIPGNPFYLNLLPGWLTADAFPLVSCTERPFSACSGGGRGGGRGEPASG